MQNLNKRLKPMDTDLSNLALKSVKFDVMKRARQLRVDTQVDVYVRVPSDK